MPLGPTSALAPAEIAWVRSFLANRPMFQLYFEAALDALAAGLDNRSFLIGRAQRGMVLSIDFDSITIRTTAGELEESELAEAAMPLGRAELHLEPAHLETVRRLCQQRIAAVKTLRYYGMNGPPPGAPDPRCRRLDAGAAEEVARFFRAHYPATVFSAWMLELPFFGLYQDGELAACGGTHALSRALGTCIIGNFLTHPERRGGGLAQAVARTLLHDLAGMGIRAFLLGAASENIPACRAYEAVGFRCLEQRPQVDLLSDPCAVQ